MGSKPRELPELQRALLEVALKARKGKIWLPKQSADTLSTTYSALLYLQKRKLIEAEPAADPGVVQWKVTKAGREAVSPAARGKSR